MTPASFPLFFQLLATDRGTVYRAYSPERIARVGKAIETLAAAVAEGSIANVTYKDTKDTLNRAMDDAWQRLDDSTVQTGTSSMMDPDLRDIVFYVHPTAHLFASVLRKVEKAPEHPYRTAALALLREIAPLAEAINGLKDKTVKRRVLTEEERRAERYRAPVSSSKAVEIVQGMLRQVVNDQFEALREVFYTYNMSVVASFEAGLTAADADPSLNERYWADKFADAYTLDWHFSNKKTARHEKKVFADKVALASHAFEWGTRPTGKRGMVKMANAEAVMLEKATRDAEDVRDFFVAKNLRKIVSILEAKGDENFDRAEIVNQSVDISGLEGTLRFVFRDGSEFKCKNAVVFVVNSYGTRFYRFPLTFTDVVLPGGAKMKAPSEERMNTAFLGKVS